MFIITFSQESLVGDPVSQRKLFLVRINQAKCCDVCFLAVPLLLHTTAVTQALLSCPTKVIQFGPSVIRRCHGVGQVTVRWSHNNTPTFAQLSKLSTALSRTGSFEYIKERDRNVTRSHFMRRDSVGFPLDHFAIFISYIKIFLVNQDIFNEWPTLNVSR